MKCAGQPKSCLFFAGSGSPVATGHCGSFDKIWGEDTMSQYERQIQGVSTCSTSPERRGGWVGGTSWRMCCRSGTTVPTEHKPSVPLWHTQLWVNSLDLLRLQQGSVQHLLLNFSEQASKRILEKCWEVNGSFRGTGSLRCVFGWLLKPNPYDERTAMFYTCRLWECWSLRNSAFVTCKVWLNFEVDVRVFMHLKY